MHHPLYHIFLLTLCFISKSIAQAELKEHTQFGKNLGNLKLFIYAPNTPVLEKVPLVVVLHGCSQNAKRVAEQSGWNELAASNNFVVIYPEQKRSNNTSNCFNWFNKKDIGVNNGESASILEMINYTAQNYTIDSSRIFIYGLSAGAAMTINLLAHSPSTFQAGATFAGGPYGIAESFLSASSAMSNPPSKSPKEWASYVPHAEYYPRLIIGHGTNDNVVDFQNSQELIKQWTFLHQLDKDDEILAPNFANNPLITRVSYHDSLANERVIFYQIQDTGHALPVDPGPGEAQGGRTYRVLNQPI